MPIDLGILGLVLTFIAPGLFTFESAIFNSVDPKDIGPLLSLRVEKIQSRLFLRVFREMDDDVARSTLSLELDDEALKKSLVEKREYVAQELGKAIWDEAANHLKIKSCFDSWSRWIGHGRYAATVWTFIDFVLFGVISVMVFTNSLPTIIRDYYYWIAFSILIIPLTYIFICWLLAYHWKQSFDRLSDS